ncbi:hypothetical protein AB0P21_07805 [Kribbella sp. NPDC056861]|uniref:hypothetical protein n=1 Tax=Kribbella sp. NPDC056861 TaxID=3154857 RepID=UPI0034226F14
MRIHPLHVSPWIVGGTVGVGIGVVFLGLTAGTGSGVPVEVLISAALSSVVISAGLGIVIRRAQRRFAPDVAGMSRDAATLAFQAAQGGKVPVDPEIRAAAVRIAERHLASAGRTRNLVVMCAALVLGFLMLGRFSLPGAVLLGLTPLVLVYSLFIPRMLRHRVKVLRAAA